MAVNSTMHSTAYRECVEIKNNGAISMNPKAFANSAMSPTQVY